MTENKYARRRVTAPAGGPKITREEYRADSEINTILAKYRQTGTLPVSQSGQPFWGDFSEIPSLQEAYEVMADAEANYLTLSASVRDASDNNPATFLQMMQDPEGFAALRNAGLEVLVDPTPVSEPSDAPLSTGSPGTVPVAKDDAPAS